MAKIIFTSYTGETWQEKIWEHPGTESLRGRLQAEGVDAIVVTKLDEIACEFSLPFSNMIDIEQ